MACLRHLPPLSRRRDAAIEWDADTPPGTGIEILTQTGVGFETVVRYTDANGGTIERDRWELLKSFQQGPIFEDRVRDASWSSFSDPHRVTGERFLSPTPRRWLRVLVCLVSEDPDAFPSLRSLTLLATEPVINAGVVGRIEPREAVLDSLQDFTYTIAPLGSTAGDAGFDRVLIKIPPEAGEAEVTSVRVGSRTFDGVTAELSLDSLLISLPAAALRRDSVEISFRTRVFQNPTVFDSLCPELSSARGDPGSGPGRAGSDLVFVPEVFESSTFLLNIAHDRVVTPNGDGVNDELAITFNLVRTAGSPKSASIVWMGIRWPSSSRHLCRTGRARYVWSGTAADGGLVPPGVYLLRLRANTDANDETVVRLVHVVY